MRVVYLPVSERIPRPPLILDAGFVAQPDAGSLRIVDLRGAEPMTNLELSGVIAAAAAGGRLLTLDEGGAITRWRRDDGRWTEDGRFASPRVPKAHLAASASGRFVFVDGARGRLIDLDGGRIVTELDARMQTARPCFDLLPDGREVLFVAAPGYMSVRMIDAARGERIGEHEEQTSWDFCHVDFALALGGARLVTFGCVWAAPYETRIYDATAWTADGTASTKAFPLPIVRIIEPLACNTLLAAQTAADGREATSACLEERAELLPAADGERPPALDALPESEPELAAQLDGVSGEGPWVLMARRIDLRDGRTVSSSVHAIAQVPEQHVHYASDHRIVVAGPRLLVCNARDDRLQDCGALHLPERAATAVTPDAAVLVVARP